MPRHPAPTAGSSRPPRNGRLLPELRRRTPNQCRSFSWVWLAALATTLSLADPPKPAGVEPLLKSLESRDIRERQRAIDGLSAHRASAEAHAPALRAGLGDPDAEVRQRAAMALAGLGVGEGPVIEELLAGMGRRMVGRYLDQPEPAIVSMHALVALGPRAVPALLRAMDDDAYPGRDLAVRALGDIGPDAKDAVPALTRRARVADVPNRCRAVEAKWRIDGDGAFARAQVMPLLDVAAGRECNGAVQTLELLGAEAAPAMPALIAALWRHESSEILNTVATLAPHAREQALPALREALQHPGLANDAAIHLQNLGEPSGPLITHQLKRLRACTPNDGTDPMRIVYTIVIHGPEAKTAYGDLRALLKHDTPAVRQAAAWGLPRIFADEGPVIAALQEMVEDPAAGAEAARSLKMLEEAQR